MEVIAYRPFEHEGKAYVAAIVPDEFASPHGEDWASAEDIAKWHRDEWRYVGVIVTDVYGAEASLWAVVYGQISTTQITLDNIMNDPYMDVDGVSYTLPVCLIGDLS